MANVPGTSGPVDYPNRPEGGPEGGAGAGSPLPGGTARYPEPFDPNMPIPRMGAGVPGTGGLTPNPGEPASGSVVIGWRGDSYANSAPPNAEADQGLDVAQQVSGDPREGAGGIDTPDTFKPL